MTTRRLQTIGDKLHGQGYRLTPERQAILRFLETACEEMVASLKKASTLH